MKRLLFTFLISVTTLALSAQQSTIDERLLVKYERQELKALQAENPEELKYLNYTVENAFRWGVVPNEKVQTRPEKFQEITLKNTSETNFYKLDLKILPQKSQYFIVNGSDLMLTIKSKQKLLLELKK
jgi:hypothetical protein